MKRYVIANWKMYVGSPTEAKKIFNGIDKRVRGKRNAALVVCPPAIFLSELKRGYRGKVEFGVQDIFFEAGGAWTGGVSAEMAKAVGASYVIVGHSERRMLGEDNSTVERKLKAVLRAGMSPILCIGERERDPGGDYFGVIKEEIVAALRTVPKREAKKILVAYEPIFAIGKTATDALTPGLVEEMSIFIRKILTELYNAEIAKTIPILYGGSVEAENAPALAGTSGIAGFLVGHASVMPEQLSLIMGAVSTSPNDHA